MGSDNVTDVMGNRRIAQGEATRRHLLGVATRLFAEQGYDETSVEEVLRTAGVSRGSLYHHFAGKDRLFEAVVEHVEQEIIVTGLIETGAKHRDPVRALRAGCAAWLALVEVPAVRQIVLIDAPAVLGWQRWREIDERYGFGLMKEALTAVAAAGRLAEADIDVVGHLLLGALNEAAMLVARATAPGRARRQAIDAVDRLIDGFLRTPGPSVRRTVSSRRAAQQPNNRT
jgi:AcrR family transcriptional regulator